MHEPIEYNEESAAKIELPSQSPPTEQRVSMLEEAAIADVKEQRPEIGSGENMPDARSNTIGVRASNVSYRISNTTGSAQSQLLFGKEPSFGMSLPPKGVGDRSSNKTFLSKVRSNESAE